MEIWHRRMCCQFLASWAGDVCAAMHTRNFSFAIFSAALPARLCAPRSGVFCQVIVLGWLSINSRYTQH